MKTIYWIKIILLITILGVKGYTQSSPILITSSEYLIDKSSQYSFEDIQKRNIDWVRFSENQNIKYGYNTDDAVWCKIILYNPTKENVEKWLVFDNIYLDSVSVYNNNTVSIRGDRTGDENAITIAPSFKLSVGGNDSLCIIARLKKKMSFLEFKYHFADEYPLLRSSGYLSIFYAFVFGLITLFFLFNLILYFVSKRKIYLRYSWYVVTILAYIMIASGFAKFYLFPSLLYFSELRIYVSFVTFSAFIMFVAHYMNFKETQQTIFKIIRVANYLSWTVLIISFVFYLLNIIELIKPSILTNYLNVVFSIIIIIIGLLRSFKTQRKKAIYTLSVFSILVVWSLLFMLKEATKLDFNHNIDWLFISSIYEVILFGVLLAMEYYQTFIYNQTLMQEVITEKEKNLRSFAEGEVIERKRLANTLHDNFGSRLSTIKLFLIQQLQQKATDELEILSSDIRNLSHQIMPRSLQEGALFAALEKHISIQNEANKSLLIELYQYDFPESTDELWIYDIYLISQEIINNAVKHSKATTLTIELFAYDDEFIFQYTDNGIGFKKNESGQGSGLSNIELRIKKHHGKFEMNTFKDQGTHIIIQIPRKV